MSKKPSIAVTIELHSDGGTVHKKNINYVANGVNLFFNAQHLLIQLSPKERAFFDYLCEVMRVTDNDVYIDTHLKTAFIEQVAKITGARTKITKNSVSKFVQKLECLGLIISTQDKARYIVNPKYVFKGTAGARKTCLKKLIQDRIKLKLAILPLINEPENSFLKTGGK